MVELKNNKISQSERNSNGSIDYTKLFIDRQIALKRYLKSVECFTLLDIIHDPLVVYSIDKYYEAYKEQQNITKIKKVLRGINKLKKKKVDIGEQLKEISPEEIYVSRQEENKFHVIPKNRYKNVLFPLLKETNTLEFTKDIAMNEFIGHINHITAKTKISIQQSPFTRNLSVSSSHNNLFKKLDKSGEAIFTKDSSVQLRTTDVNSAVPFNRTGMIKNGNDVPHFSQFLNKKNSPGNSNKYNNNNS